MKTTSQVEERFWAKVVKTETCWLRAGPGKYGTFAIGGRSVASHRFAWELEVGPIPPGMLVCHHCDNPPCVNPSHLFLGTKSDNAKDMVAKNRHGWGTNPPKPFIQDGTMKTISLRQFSNVVQELVEPVQVAKREKKGVLRILGTWTPVDFRPTATYSTNLGNATNSASTWTHWHPTKPDER